MLVGELVDTVTERFATVRAELTLDSVHGTLEAVTEQDDAATDPPYTDGGGQ
ncbi:MAG: hypothetical protein ACO3VO_09190 [Ilumatobacteraceae bacterium]